MSGPVSGETRIARQIPCGSGKGFHWHVTDEPGIAVADVLAIMDAAIEKHTHLAANYGTQEPMRYHHNAIAGFLATDLRAAVEGTVT